MSLMPTVRCLPALLVLSLTPVAGAEDRDAATAAGLDVPPAVLAAESRRIEAASVASRAAVSVFAGEQGGGSGVLISPDGFALTNFHVVQPAGVAMRCGLADGSLHEAVLVGLDPTGDVAVVKLLGRDDFPCAEMADSDEMRVGDGCFTVGNPFLLATNLQPSVGWGIVSGVHRYQFPAGTILEYADCLQVDAPINPGNSGGGLFDAAGRLIGINGRASFEKRGRVNVGVGYAISINQIRNFLGGLRGGRLVDHATLGATVATAFDGRIVVSDILESSDAFRRGLRYDDEIVSLAGRPVRTVNAFKNVLGTLPASWQVPLVYRRDGRPVEILVRLAGVHAPAELAAIVAGRRPRSAAPQTPPPDDERPEPLPDAVRDLYEARGGFANYHFNRLETARVAAVVAAAAPAERLRGTWRLVGRLLPPDAAGDPGATAGRDTRVRIELGDDVARIDLPTGSTSVDPAGDLDSNPNPPGSGGLLAALVLWRRLLLEGPAALGRTEYLGTLFPGGHGQPSVSAIGPDCLVAYAAGVEARFAIDAEGGHVTAIDLWTAPTADPCEVRFSGSQPGDAAAVPQVIEVLRGQEAFATIRIESLEVVPPAGESEPDGDSNPDQPSASDNAAVGGGVGGLALALATLLAGEPAEETTAAGPRSAERDVSAITRAAAAVVKIYGAGGFRGLESYQTGFLVSSDGLIATVMSTVLDSDSIDCVLDDGRRYAARLVGIDPRYETALLRIEAEDLPFFPVEGLDERMAPPQGDAAGNSSPSAPERPAGRRVPPGTRVFALSNLFGVAMGDERVSVQQGVVSTTVPLQARRGAYEAPYSGEVYILDSTVNNPGSPGGVLVDLEGNAIGMLGKELRASESGIWLNYALPIDEVAASVRSIRASPGGLGIARTRTEPDPQAEIRAAEALRLGIVLVPDLLDRTPPFVDRIIPGSPADRAGLRADDLLIAVGGRSVSTRAAVQQALSDRPARAVLLAVVRDGRIVECALEASP
jgi:serine protease Do